MWIVNVIDNKGLSSIYVHVYLLVVIKVITVIIITIITFRVRHSGSEMYIGHMHLCVCVSLSLTAFPCYCTDPDVTWGNCRGCPLVVHYWVDLQLVHGFRCYDNIAPNAKCQRVLVLALWLVELHNIMMMIVIILSNSRCSRPGVIIRREIMLNLRVSAATGTTKAQTGRVKLLEYCWYFSRFIRGNSSLYLGGSETECGADAKFCIVHEGDGLHGSL